MSAVKYVCGACAKSSFAEPNYLGLCKKCSTDGTALRNMRVRTIVPPVVLFQVPAEACVYPRGMASDTTAIPAIHVVEFGENIQRNARHNKSIILWCADPVTLRRLFAAAKEMVTLAAAGFSTDGVHRTIWFGAESDTRKWSSIGAKLVILDNYLQNILQTLKFGCTYGDGIAAIDPTTFDATSVSVTVLLDRGFCWRRFSDGEIICSIIHEFTHIICGTKDEKLGSDDQYGLTKCQALASAHPDQAWVNADNWAYYICEYRNGVTNFGTIDWAYLDTATFTSRSPLGKNMPPP